MWSYELPCGAFRTEVFTDDSGQLRFNPPVYEQRYMTVIRILEDERWKTELKKIVDFGCAEMSLLALLRNVKGLQRILMVDIEEETLQLSYQRAKPIISDWVRPRDHPLRVEVLKGSITSSVECLRHTDVVIGVEIIEHLYEYELQDVPANVFGFVQPKLAIFSTPNAEANVLFDKLLPNGFRHPDHKFEWTRAQFQQWALDICERYPNYSVAFLGAGMLPEAHKHLGSVSQFAVFARHDLIDRPLATPIDTQLPASTVTELQYKEIYAVDFPYKPDDRNLQQKILEEVQYQVARLRRVDDYFDKDQEVHRIPIKMISCFTAQYECDDKQLRTFLVENNYKLDGDFLIEPQIDEQDFPTYSESDDGSLAGEGDYEAQADCHDPGDECWD